ncbi:MAG: peptidoglycan DD-metalloendopeptidase family protein [Coriobacteriales bacterium]|nr:peptidoglycan DD-metalloendopeptidase family protein [Coriobacteriales bacterium]
MKLTRSKRRLCRLPLIVFTLALVLLLGWGGEPVPAVAATSAEKQAEVDEALGRLDTLQTELNQLADDYQNAVLARLEAEERMLEARAREEAAIQRISELQQQLGSRAQYMYRSGSGSFLDVLFGAQSFSDFINAFDMINRVNDQDAKLVQESRVARAEAEAARIEFTEQERVAKEKQEQIGTLKKERENTAASLASEIEQLKTEAAELLVQEELAAEAARKAAEAAAASSSRWGSNVSIGSAGAVSDAQLARVRALGLQFPLPFRTSISSAFGWRSFDNAFHLGTDFPASSGTPILAAASGTVTAAGYHYSMGNYVIINHGDGIRTIYMHAVSLNVGAGETVSAGNTISFVGTTGTSTGNHLHFQVEVDQVAVNPMLFL